MNRPGRPRRPAWWPITVSIGTTIGAAAAGVASNLASEYANTLLGPASVVLAIVGLAVSVWLGIRRLGTSGTDEDAEPGEPSPEPGGPGLPSLSGFTGREADLSTISEALRDHQAVAVIGRRGVGTSYCAVQAAHECGASFPDGQFYLDLRDEGRPKPPGTVLAELARKLGSEPPRSLDREALRRAADTLHLRLAGEQKLLVLDNIDDLAQIQALLPLPSGTSRLLLVGTPALVRIAGVIPHRLSEPTEEEGIRLFIAAATAGGAQLRLPNLQTEREVREIVQLCGRQPRAIRQLGRWIAQYGWRTGDLAQSLHRAATMAAHLPVPDLFMIELLNRWDTAYKTLSRGARRLYRLLALAPGPLDRVTIDVLARRGRDRTNQLIDELTAARFLTSAQGTRYRIRPLLTSYARLHLLAEEPRWLRIRAQTRLISHLARQVRQHQASLAVTMDAPERSPALRLDDDPAAWLELHQDMAHEMVRQLPEAGSPLPARLLKWWFRLATSLCAWYDRTGRLDRWAEICQLVLASSAAINHPEITGWAHNELGVLCRRNGDGRAAVNSLAQAIAERGPRSSAQASLNLALTWLDLNQIDDALEHLEHSRQHRAPGDHIGHALTDLASGVTQLVRDRADEARDHLIRAADRFRSLGDTRGYVAALTDLVMVHSRLGEHAEAAFVGRIAVAASTTLPDSAVRASALLNAGAALLAANPSGAAEAAEAYRLLARSRWLRRCPGRDGAAMKGQSPWLASLGLGRTLLHLGDAAAALDHPDRARRHWTTAAEVCAQVGDERGATAVQRRLGSAGGQPPSSGVDRPASVGHSGVLQDLGDQ